MNAPFSPEQFLKYSDVRIGPIRKTIARTMMASLHNSAQLTQTTSFDASDLIAYRAQLKQKGADYAAVTIHSLILFAVSRVLKKHPNMNAHFVDDSSLRQFESVNLGSAVDTSRGLYVPVLFGAEKLSLLELSQKAKELSKAVQEGTISPDMLSGGTFTVTNLGMMGIESFTPILNPPQVGILGVNTIMARQKFVDGEAVTYRAIPLSLTFDHRVIDGAPAAKFLRELCETLEHISEFAAKEEASLS